MRSRPDTVVLLTTWNRPALLARALPDIERESARIGARLIICDDRSDDPATLDLLRAAGERGAEVLVRPRSPERDERVDWLVHGSPREAVRRLITSPAGSELVARCARQAESAAVVRDGLRRLWNATLSSAYLSTQENNLFGLRYVLTHCPDAHWILKVDDDVQLKPHAFATMHERWTRAERAGHDVLAVSGLRTINERLQRSGHGFGLTVGICNVAVLYRRADWARCLARLSDQQVIDKGFDLAFAGDYAPAYRRGAVAVCVQPSVVFHAGHHGVNVHGEDINCDFTAELPPLGAAAP